MATEIIQFGASRNGSGGRMCAFNTDTGLRVTVEHSDKERDSDVYDTAKVLARAHHAVIEAHKEIGRLVGNCATLRSKIPPTKPARLLGPGCVRFSDTTGELWVLNKRETGWASFGYVVDGWDDLFRRYNVRVTAHGTDKTGAYWTIEPIGGAS